MSDDLDIARQLEDAAWEELDRQGLITDDFYVDTIAGYVEGKPDVVKLIHAILLAYWEENGR